MIGLKGKILYGQRGERAGANEAAPKRRAQPATRGIVVKPTLEWTSRVKKHKPMKKRASASCNTRGSALAMV